MSGIIAPRAFLLAAVLLALAAPSARAATTPPADSLTVEYRWLDRISTPWKVRVRLVRYTTLGTQGGAGAYCTFAIRTPDSSAVQGLDSALVVHPWTLLTVPGFPRLVPNALSTARFRTHPAAPLGGFWAGALGASAMSTTFPARPVDVCLFLSVVPGTADSTMLRTLGQSTFGSATANAGANLTGNVRFKGAFNVLFTLSGGGSGAPIKTEP